jgi:hypothetical protein
VVADQGGGVAGWVVVAVHGCALLVWGYSEVRRCGVVIPAWLTLLDAKTAVPRSVFCELLTG